jgi:hypothetical protein
MNINEIAKECYLISCDHGFHDADDLGRSLPEKIALMHSELSEALESWRNHEEPFFMRDGKPEGWGVELADCIIRIFDTMVMYKLDPEQIILHKMTYNKTRPRMHGGKRC